MDCPCYSEKNYALCCEPYHKGSPAPNALFLMRSRYAAYALSLSDYIQATTHPDHPDCKQDPKIWQKAILDFCQETKFANLEIINFSPTLSSATVTFRATLYQDDQDCSFTEQSLFLLLSGKWLYHSGIIE